MSKPEDPIMGLEMRQSLQIPNTPQSEAAGGAWFPWEGSPDTGHEVGLRQGTRGSVANDDAWKTEKK